jgi:hypothetical protein
MRVKCDSKMHTIGTAFQNLNTKEKRNIRPPPPPLQGLDFKIDLKKFEKLSRSLGLNKGEDRFLNVKIFRIYDIVYGVTAKSPPISYVLPPIIANKGLVNNQICPR